MEVLYPPADWRPLGPQTEPAIGTPRVLIFHTMVGFLVPVDRMFRSQGFTGVESTFGVGGPWDGADLDGAVWQWQRLDYQADAQAEGNAYATSVETSDAGDPSNKWSPNQLDSLIALTVWWCQQTGNPCRMVEKITDHGIGYHRQFPQWNPNNHTCPGDVRLNQLKTVVIPEAAKILEGDLPLTNADADLVVNRFLNRVIETAWQEESGLLDPRNLEQLTLGQLLAEARGQTLALVHGNATDLITKLSTAVVAALPPPGPGGSTGLTDADKAAIREIVVEVLHSAN